MLKRKRPTCSELGRKCRFGLARELIHHSPDGRVFRVRRLVCGACGEAALEAKQLEPQEPQEAGSSEPWWMGGAMVEANF